MKSDVKTVLFESGLKKNASDKLQTYIDGENDWEEVLLEKDIIDVKFSASSILLLHRAPTPKITG